MLYDETQLVSDARAVIEWRKDGCTHPLSDYLKQIKREIELDNQAKIKQAVDAFFTGVAKEVQ